MTLTLQTPPMEEESVLRDEEISLRFPDDPAARKDFRERLAVMLYDMRAVSQGNAAKIAGLTRSAFFDALGRHGVTPFQYDDEDDLHSDVERAMQW